MIRHLGGWVATTLTRGLLRIYPSSFRREMGEQMVEDVRRRAGEFQGPLAPVTMAAWLIRLGASLVANAIGLWREGRVAAPERLTAQRSGAFSWLDVKLGLRMLLKYPGLTSAGGLGIAVAIAISGGFFTFAYAHFYPTIPLPEGDRLVGLENWDLAINNENRRSIHDFYIWREEMVSVEDMAAFTNVGSTLVGAEGRVERINVAHMTPSGFALAQVPPLLGRRLVEGDMEAGAPLVIVIGYDVWTARFAADPDILGTDLRLDNTPHEVVGVMPEGFAFPMDHDYWVPLKEKPTNFALGEGPRIFISGRLAPGYNLEAAQAEFTVIGARMAEEFPETHGQYRAQVMKYVYPLLDVNQQGGATFFWQIAMMNLMVSLVLIVVCLNVAVLVYARAATRRGEIAIRAALGASRLRIVGQMFVEMLVLCCLAAAVGVVILKFGLTQAELMMETEMGRPFWMNLGLSGPGMAFVLALTLLAALITGVLPALQSTGRNVQASLNRFSSHNGPQLGRTWTVLIIMQVAVAVTALPLATAMAWWEIRGVTTSLALNVDQFILFGLGRHSLDLRNELSRRLESDADAIEHAFVLGFPGGIRGRIGSQSTTEAGAAWEEFEVRTTLIGPGFLEMVGAAAVAGRPLLSGDWDREIGHVAVVNRALADRYLGGGDAVGKRFRYANEEGAFVDAEDDLWVEVVGVVEDLQENRLDPDLVQPRIFRPLSIGMEGPISGLVKTAGGDPGELVSRLRGHMVQLDPELQAEFLPLAVLYRQEQLAIRLAALALALTILAVMTLTSAGIYAMMSFTVSRRRREIGIRTALGAHPSRLLGGIFGGAVRQIALGVVIGVGVALGLDRLAGGELLHGLGSLLLTVMILLMAVVGLMAALGPARRGLLIAPMEALSGD
jgi:putative ABC transport system permease protein